MYATDPGLPRAVPAPLVTLLMATVALNLLGLAMPIAAQQIFNRVIPNPGNATLTLLVLLIVGIGATEAGLRLARAHLLIQTGSRFAAEEMSRLLRKVVAVERFSEKRGAAASLEQIANIHKVKDRYSGQLLVARAELMFLPVILGLIVYIAPIAGAIVLAIMLASVVATYRDAMRLSALADSAYATLEARYAFLFSVLDAIHSLKALGIEQNVIRRYERVQAAVAETGMAASLLIGRLTNQSLILSQLLTIAVLIHGAYSVATGRMSLGAVSAVVLLAGRLLQPLQRAIFIFVQARDLDKAEASIAALHADDAEAAPSAWIEIDNSGWLVVDALLPVGGGDELSRGVSLEIRSGETLALAGGSERTMTALLRAMAGIDRPAEGEIRLNGVELSRYPLAQRNRCVAYLSPDGRLFDGTIRDNITRFGDVSVEDALAVARMMEIDQRINELPMGLETRVTGGANDTIAPGLRQQIAMLRGLALRPQLILIDNADRGLDRESYDRFARFLGKIHGQASILIVTEDFNLAATADRRFVLSDGSVHDSGGVARTSYRSLKL